MGAGFGRPLARLLRLGLPDPGSREGLRRAGPGDEPGAVNLQNSLAYDIDLEDRGSEIAYALYVLARNKRASVGDLRYYSDTQLEAFSSPMAVAQLAASLALYGDAQRSEAAFTAALQLATEHGGIRLVPLRLWLEASRRRRHAGAGSRKPTDAVGRA